MSGIDVHTLRYAANKVAKLASKLLKSSSGKAYEQGIGAEMASRMLMKEAERLDRIKKSR